MRFLTGIMLLFFLLIIYVQCSGKCTKVTTGCPILTIEAILATTSENVFTNCIHQSSQIAIIDERNQNVKYNFIYENSVNFLHATINGDDLNQTIL
jgi:hypothetical protein